MSPANGVRGGVTAVLLGLATVLGPAAQAGDVERLVAALVGETPLLEDVRTLTDEVGGRPTGAAANLRAVEWGLARFRAGGVEARAEAFTMPARWLERSARATVTGAVTFTPQVAAMPFSTATPPGGLQAPLRDGGAGSVKDFERLGAAAKGAFVLVETPELLDL
ncbi:MAG TPA: peptidase M28, partial [Vicinamibacteria bacterium]|nr:peptidase M28 [Vicinamibacteria bacterium]